MVIKKSPEPSADADSDLWAPSTERTKAFRKKLQESPAALTRWEIVASSETKARVRTISAIEGLTAGVAAEALIGLGIEAYASSQGFDLTTLDRLADPEQRHAVVAELSMLAAPALGVPSASANAGASWSAGASRAMNFAAAAPDTASQGAFLGAPPLVKSLATYSSRSNPTENRTESTLTPPSPPASASAMLQGLFDRSKTRKQR